MSKNSKLHFDSKCVHSGIEEYEYGPVVPPIYQTSTFKFENAKHGADLFKGEREGYIYSRMGNPTVEAMENAVADLEGGYKALGCASGMAAISTTFFSLLKSGDHVVCSKAVYGPTNTLLNNIFTQLGVEVSFVETSSTEEVESSVRSNTKVIYVETPGNPTLSVADLKSICALAKKVNAKVVVDNTFMSPALQQPIKFGVDVVVHSMTKFLNGHADVVAGVIVVNDETTYKHFRKTLNQLGGVIDPFNAFLVHRGLKTLSIRMQRHCENAQIIAEWLKAHPAIEWVKYPGLKDDPGYEIGKVQHSGSGGMITFEVKGGFSAGETVMNSVKFCQLAVSLGGVETLIQHPASMTHLTMGEKARAVAGISEGLVRLSVGIENVNDIINDLEQAFKNASQKIKEEAKV
ncbi:MAG: aminotransferase class I/II-fold pyridoxal phosphate-dependent enzyme [Melioribacteraceae bacterium]|nr:aminotransferase class I/II-fold pyridoxal phosphate-dependent enzyme [Melioribacteraceae bacterium]